MSKQATTKTPDEGPPEAVRRAMKKGGQEVTPPDRLEELKKLVRNARTLSIMIGEKKAEVAELEGRLAKAKNEVIPTFMDEIRVPSITIDAEGNYPAFECVARPFYRANIAADWEPAKKEEAFAYLESIGEGDLIKTSVTYYFTREEAAMVKPFLAAVTKLKFTIKVVSFIGKGKKRRKTEKTQKVSPPPAVVEKTVQWNTLTAWLRRKVETSGTIPKLDKIGGAVGTVADLKPVEVQKAPQVNQ